MITLQLHGPPRVIDAHGRARALAPREAALLALLHLDGPAPRAALAGRLWPAGTESQARANLRQLLLRLKRDGGALLAETGGALALARGVTVRESAGAPLLGTLAFDDAPELAQWLADRRDAEQRERQRLGLARARRALSDGDLDAAMAAADALLAADAALEEAHRVRMQVHYQRGDRAAAIAAWDECKLALRQAFGIAPSAATQELGQFLLAAAPGGAADALTGRTATAPGDTAAPVQAGSVAAVLALPAALRRPPLLAGREALLSDLLAAFTLGHTLLLRGPGGIGKTRLVQALVAAWSARDRPPITANRGPAPRLLQVAARLGDAGDAGALLRRVLLAAAQVLGSDLIGADEAPEALDGERLAAAPLRSPAEQREWLEWVQRYFAACARRGLEGLVVEDLHHADAASTAALARLAAAWLDDGADNEPRAETGAGGGDIGATAGPPMLRCIFSFRADELPPEAEAALSALARHGHVQVADLAPLDSTAIAALLHAVGPPAAWRDASGLQPLAEALAAGVGGNPAHVLEAVRQLWLQHSPAAAPQAPGWHPGQSLPLPPTLLASFEQRLRRLPGDALPLAQLAAVAERDFDLELAVTLLERPLLALSGAVDALERAHLFQGGRPSHDLVTQAIGATIAPPLAAALHARVAAALVQREAAAARIARHWRAAGRAAELAPWALRAADDARSRWQLTDAGRWYDQAAAAFESSGRFSEALAAAGQAVRAWLLREQQAEAERSLALAERCATREPERVMLLVAQAACRFKRRDLAGFNRLVIEMQAPLEATWRHLPPAELAQALRQSCLAIQNDVVLPGVLPLCKAAAPVLAAAGADTLALGAVAQGSALHWLGRPREAARVLDAADAALDARSDPGARMAVLNQLMRVRHSLGDLPGAIACAERLLPLARLAEGGVVYEADVRSVLGAMLAAAGRAAEGLRHFDRLRERMTAAGLPPREWFSVSEAHAAIGAGQHRRAAALLAGIARAPGDEGWVLYDRARVWVQARLALASGDTAAAAQALSALQQLPAMLGGPELHRRACLLASGTPRRAEALALADELSACGYAALERMARLAAAEAAWREGDAASARQQADAALRLEAAVDAWADEPAALWIRLAALFDALGDTARAAALRARGRAWVHERSVDWPDAAAREAWCRGNPLHAGLLREPMT